ncbi:methyltransferase type 12 [Methyloglobulus morosus KoM1]|uniref:Methyltransferase type 12 n=1 Tax=Methyloglobulus morosus KoM1 TaxID=1116472 RepID=V5B1C1_9GAMM|nr:class I SAM-dependent methyltransferase [Methyloglobulus morosus]ESS66970.1 methyltransferase type 12 [Methyloglobulus morosus KoM1]
MKTFDGYSQYYDLLYRDKNYLAEAEYVVSHIKKYLPHAKQILELGCGTGAHAEHLARLGFAVVGVDMSETMLACAEARKAKLPKDIGSRLTFIRGDVRSVRTGQAYDAVISLFHVMSYQTSNADLKAVFATAADHLSVGGMFLYDYWYGPAVLTQKPEVRVKRLEDDMIKITRIAEPVMHVNENLVDVNYSVFIKEKLTGKMAQLNETHRMRYLFLPELWFLASADIWVDFNSYAWLKSTPLTIEDWSGFAVLMHR